MLTIGEFARRAGLTPKALRIYDDLGLLSPAAVDADSGYRFYDPAQLGRARLIAELRRIGMPLARIAEVVALPPGDRPAAVRAYWDQVRTATAARGRLAGLLVDELSGRSTTMEFRFAARTDRGLVRPTNDDHAYAGSTLLAVADGVGSGGAAAAEAAVAAVRERPLTDLNDLVETARAAEEAVRALADGSLGDSPPATTLTALLRSGSQLGLIHVGDSRAYLRRGDELFRLTADHTYVQSQVDAGALSPAEAAGHPDRALLMRAVGARGEADISLRTALPGDRYLLCSDGLSAVVEPAAVAGALAGGDPDQAVERLIELARSAGAPDNVAVVVADVTD
jgi:serine/threonine protein phosphatase PrpC